MSWRTTGREHEPLPLPDRSPRRSSVAAPLSAAGCPLRAPLSVASGGRRRCGASVAAELRLDRSGPRLAGAGAGAGAAGAPAGGSRGGAGVAHDGEAGADVDRRPSARGSR